MKRKVRIYKAQLGGVQAVQETQQVEQSNMQDEQILMAIMARLDNGDLPEEVLDSLMQAGIDQTKATELINGAIQYSQDQDELQKAENQGDVETADDLQAEQEMIEAQAEQDRQDQILAQMYESDPYADDTTEEDYQFVEENILPSSQFQKTGGVPNKRTFVRKMSKTIKAQMGQEMPTMPADSTDTGARQMMMSAFLKSVQDTGNNALIKQDAEAMFDAISQYPYEDYNMPTAQFGGMSRGQQRRMGRRLNRMISRMPIPMYGYMPQGFVTYPMLQNMQGYMPAQGSVYGGPRLANIDVRKTGLFGRPKEYTITFAQEAFYNPTLKKQVIKQEARNENVLTEDEIDEQIKKEEEITGETSETAKAEEKKEADGKKDVSGNTTTSKANTASTRKPSATSKKPVTPTPTIDQNAIAQRLYEAQQQRLPPWMQGINVYDQRAAPINPMDNAVRQYNRDKMQRFYPQRQMGGYTDQASGLTKFIDGGEDMFAFPSFGGKLTNSPYFEEGGYFQTAGETNSTSVEILDSYNNVIGELPQSEAEKRGLKHRVKSVEEEEDVDTSEDTYQTEGYNSFSPFVFPQGMYFQQKGLPYYTGTNTPYAGYITPWTNLKSIEVKNRLLGAPKLTYNFGNYDPTAPLIGPNGTTTQPKSKKPLTGTKPSGQNRVADFLIKSKLAPGLGSRMYEKDIYSPSETMQGQFPEEKERTGFGMGAQRFMFNLTHPFAGRKAEGGAMSYAYGGDLDYAQVGENYPYIQDPRFAPVYTDNPNLVGMSDVDMVSPSAVGMVGDSDALFEQSAFADYNPGANAPDITQTTSYEQAQLDPTLNMEIDPNQPMRQTQKKNLVGDFSIKGKAKSKDTREERLIKMMMANTLIDKSLSALGERGDRRATSKLKNRYLSDNLYGSKGSYDRGTYEINSGLFRPDQMGFTGVAKNGGSMYREGGVHYMSADQVKKFLEEGGELEFV